MSAKTKTPALRFKNFTEAWEETTLGELVKLENGFAFKSKYFKKEPTDVIVLTPGSVNIGGGFQEGKGQYYDAKLDVPDKYVFKAGDIFITMTDLTPTAQALGFPAIVPKDDNTYLHNQRLGKLTDFNGDLGFLFHLLCTQKKQKEVVLTSSGTTVKHTSSTKFLNRYSCFPEKTEQTKIGNYFQQLDTLIAQHQQKHDKLLNLKKALLEKIFPKQGATVPEIRFKGFSGEWEEKKLGEIADFSKGQGYSKSDLVSAGTPIILYGRLYTQYQTVICEVDTFSIKSNKSVISNGNEVIVPASGETAEDISRASAILQSGVLLGGDLNIIYPNKELDSIFLALTLSNGKPQKALSKKAQGKSVVHLRNNDLKEVDISYPDFKEQAKIGELFREVDRLIAQHQAQMTKLGNIKQACLEKMFV
jgi:type I restriction enzyme S subunit